LPENDLSETGQPPMTASNYPIVEC